MGYKLLLISVNVLIGLTIVALGILQFVGTWAFYPDVLEWNVIVSAIALVITGPMPVVGTVLGIIGFSQGIGWGVGFSIGVYVALYVVATALGVLVSKKGPYWEAKAYKDQSLL